MEYNQYIIENQLSVMIYQILLLMIQIVFLYMMYPVQFNIKWLFICILINLLYSYSFCQLFYIENNIAEYTENCG